MSTSWGGKRKGAGRPPNAGGNYVRDSVREGAGSRTSIYRSIRYIRRLTPEARNFAVDPNNVRLITGKALDRAGEFETADEQLAVLKLAIELRKARRRLTLITAMQYINRLELSQI